MLYQYAITPDAFEPSSINSMVPKGVVLLQLLRGIQGNGLLADLDQGAWMKHVLGCLNEPGMDPDVKDRVESCLAILFDRKRLIKHPAGAAELSDDDFRWIHWSLHRQRSEIDLLNGIFTSDDYIGLSELSDPSLVALSQALDSDCWLQRQISATFVKTESELRKHVRPIVRYAQRLYFVDPYLSCRKDSFMRTVEVCADLLGQFDGQRHPRQVQIHAGDPTTDLPDAHRESKDDRLARWATELQPIATHSGHTFNVSLWKQKNLGKKFHDRYIITDQFGIAAPGGLDFFDDVTEERANLSTWNLLEHEQARKILSEDLHHQKSPYQYLGSKVVRP